MMNSSERTNSSLTEGGIKNLILEPAGACMSSVSESLKRNNSAEKVTNLYFYALAKIYFRKYVHSQFFTI